MSSQEDIPGSSPPDVEINIVPLREDLQAPLKWLDLAFPSTPMWKLLPAESPKTLRAAELRREASEQLRQEASEGGSQQSRRLKRASRCSRARSSSTRRIELRASSRKPSRSSSTIKAEASESSSGSEGSSLGTMSSTVSP